MASDIGFVEYVCGQIAAAGRITHRRMFGEFAVYCDGKVLALVCDNQLDDAELAAQLVRVTAQAMPEPKARPTAGARKKATKHARAKATPCKR